MSAEHVAGRIAKAWEDPERAARIDGEKALAEAGITPGRHAAFWHLDALERAAEYDLDYDTVRFTETAAVVHAMLDIADAVREAGS